jgi:hypothetical protein
MRCITNTNSITAFSGTTRVYLPATSVYCLRQTQSAFNSLLRRHANTLVLGQIATACSVRKVSTRAYTDLHSDIFVLFLPPSLSSAVKMAGSSVSTCRG